MWRCLSKTVCEGAECHPPQPRPRSKRRKLMFEDGGGQLMAMDFEDFGSGDYGADQEDTQQRKIMPVLIRETAGHLRNATPWTDSSKASPAQRLRKLWLLPASRLQLVRTSGDGPKPKDAMCGTLSQTGVLPVDFVFR